MCVGARLLDISLLFSECDEARINRTHGRTQQQLFRSRDGGGPERPEAARTLQELSRDAARNAGAVPGAPLRRGGLDGVLEAAGGLLRRRGVRAAAVAGVAPRPRRPQLPDVRGRPAVPPDVVREDLDVLGAVLARLAGVVQVGEPGRARGGPGAPGHRRRQAVRVALQRAPPGQRVAQREPRLPRRQPHPDRGQPLPGCGQLHIQLRDPLGLGAVEL